MSAAPTIVQGPGEALALPGPPPLSLYIHIPWCVRKCPYCDFNSHELRGELPEMRYVQALIADLESLLPLVWGRRVDSVFFGGGTPSLLSAQALGDILAAVRARLRLDAYAEITLEANPGTVEAVKFEAFRALGVNRLSLGIQSFNAAHLRALGRIHDDREARAAVEIALRHFENVNLDLMYALPAQGLAEALADLGVAVSSGAHHVSAYHLTLEPNTLFHRHPPSLPDDDLSADMQEAIEGELARAGFEHYETSAFARPGHRCRHNLNYWQFGDYAGIGAGAHGKLSVATPTARGHRWEVCRQMRIKHPREYQTAALAGAPLQQETVVAAAELGFEFAMNALRLIEGFETRLFTERTGLPLQVIAPQLEQAQARGWLVRDHLRVRPTRQGARFLNDLLELFLP